jgi:hypothetical protein
MVAANMQQTRGKIFGAILLQHSRDFAAILLQHCRTVCRT